MKKAISTVQTQANIDLVNTLLAETPVKLELLNRGRTDEQLHTPLKPGERSFIDVLAHLINVEARSAEAIFLALLSDEPLLVDVHAEREWGKLAHYELLSIIDLIAYFRLRRTVLSRVLSGLTAAHWSRIVREQGKKRHETVYWKARALALHEVEHLGELEAKFGSETPLSDRDGE